MAIAKHLASFGSHVILHCRTEASCSNATAAVRAVARDGSTVEAALADLTSMESVVSMTERLQQRGIKLDTVVLNAAMVDPLATEIGTTGIRRMFAVNYLVNVALLKELVQRTILTPGTSPSGARPRLVVISSGAYVVLAAGP